MNHEFRVTVVGSTQLELVKRATAAADRFYGPGNWREDGTADVRINGLGNYTGVYYFTDEPEVEGWLFQ